MPILAGSGIPAPVVIEATEWFGMGHQWDFGAESFDLTDLASGILLSQGIRGLGMPPVTQYTTDSPALAGARFQGIQVNPRSVLWPIFIWSDNASQEWIDRDRAFWSTMRPDTPGLWTVTQPNGESRSLACMFTDDGQQTFVLDPFQFGWALYGITLTAFDEPYWQGTPIERIFQPPNPVAFFAASPNVLAISPAGGTDSAVIPNPGDVEAWPIWTVKDVAGAVLGAGGGSVTVPAVSSSDLWTIDTRPDHMTAVDAAGTDHSGSVTWSPAPVPAGAEVELDITLTSPGSTAQVTCEITPRYYRAW